MSTHDRNHRTKATNDYPHQLRVFQAHASVFAVSMMLIFAVNRALNLATNTTGWSAWWSAWALIGWGLGVTVHGLVVSLSRAVGLTHARQKQQINGGDASASIG